METEPRFLTIPAGLSFVDSLARGLLREYGADDPLAIAAVTVLLPTRRAVRALREAFLRQCRPVLGSDRPLLLPRIRPIGDVDEEDLLLDPGSSTISAGDGLALPPAIPGLERQTLLARLIMEWAEARGEGPERLAQAVPLAAELARFLDQVQTEERSFEDLRRLVPTRFAEHWQITLDFLAIVISHWPAVVEEHGYIDPAIRRNRLIRALAERWRDDPPADPVIAAGSTGTIPATSELLAVVARSPAGAVVLPGLDLDMDDESWAQLGESHSQFGMKRLLEKCSVDRRSVSLWPDADVEAGVRARRRLISEALRPAETTDAWFDVARELGPDSALALKGFSIIEAADPNEEARVIALAMREVLETPGRTGALVTPDRGLARRVASELARWQVVVNDSAGTPLTQTPAGTYLRLVADTVADDLAPLKLLSMLKHPLTALGLPPGEARARVRELELNVLRGPRPGPGIEGLHAATRGIGNEKVRRSVRQFIKRLDEALKPLVILMEMPQVRLGDLLAAHVACAEALAADNDAAGSARLWAGDAGEAAALFVSELDGGVGSLPELDPRDYPELFESLMAGRAVRPKYGLHPRLFIWGPLEARLQHADLILLGGLNEGTWPPSAATDPWMSRPMRQDFGLPTPERRIGLSAHDFAQAAAAPHVIITRARKVDGTPTVPSRWILRIRNLLKGMSAETALAPAVPWQGWSAGLDRPEKIVSVGPPRPAPPLPARPRRLSVTQVETWIRDPYAIYARHVLGLHRLDPVDQEPGAADRGRIVHEALESFVAKHKDALPGDALVRLLREGEQTFADVIDRPGVYRFWWPRFKRVAEWFVEHERKHRERARPLAVEANGSLLFESAGGPFELVARADRIDELNDAEANGLAIYDYKTGRPPTAKQVTAGFSPQLPLEAAIAAAGGFEGVTAREAGELVYLWLHGGDPAGEEKRVAEGPEAADAALRGLKRLVAAYDDPAQPYLSHHMPQLLVYEGDYDHLARVKEWSAGSDTETGP